MRLPRLASSIVVPALLLAGLAAVAPAEAAPARAGTADLAINEIESDAGVPGDWVELVNTGAGAVAAGGLTVRDNDDAHIAAIPAGTVIAAGGYLVVDTAFDLGASDSARLLAADGSSLDAYTWTSTAPVTYARCVDATGVFTAVATSTRGSANACGDFPPVSAWPGGSTTTAVDPTGVLGGNVSGLAYEAIGNPGTLWAVRNSPSVLYELVKTGNQWGPASGDWATGKTLTFPGGGGAPDAEGVTFTDAGSAGGIFVSSERDGSGSSRPEILRYDPNVAGGTLQATASWNLTADLPVVGANLGPEAITWVPDSYLTARGLTDETTGAAYDPSDYANHGNGLFLAGLEANGNVYAYALDLAGTAFTRIATFSSGFGTVEDLTYEPETRTVWAACDNNCDGRTARLDVTGGTFAVTQVFERPAAMANFNNEGFTLAPQSECSGGTKPAFWADDGNTSGHAIRQSTLNCTPLPVCNGLQATIVGTGTIDGTPGDDVIVGALGPDAIDAGGGNDTVCSLGGNDVLTGGDGTDVLRAGAGVDRLVEGATANGSDVLDGGADLDTIDYSARTAAVVVNRDSVANDGAAGEKDNVVGCETIQGGSGADTLTGGDGADTLVGNGGNDRLAGGKGNDTLRGGAGVDTLLEGNAANGADLLDGGADLDTVDYSARSAAVSVSRDSAADDGATGEKDNSVNTETLIGGAGDDTLSGSNGAEILIGNGGDDTLIGGAGNDQLRGGSGEDTLDEGATPNGADVLDGGADYDVLDYSGRTTVLTVSRDGVANDGAAGEKDNTVGTETIIGGTAGDTLIGSAGRDYLIGGGGNDTLTGLGGDDNLFGGDNSDTLTGGAGNDLLFGEAGTDTLNTVDGVSGNDTANGGADVDTAQTDAGDTVVDVP